MGLLICMYVVLNETPIFKKPFNIKGVLVKILETHTPLFEEGCYEDIIKSVRTQASELYAVHTCPLFPVIVHGNVRNLVFKYNNKDEVVGVKLPSLRFASIGSPLLDIYGAVHSAKSGLHETSTALRGRILSRVSLLTVLFTCWNNEKTKNYIFQIFTNK